MDPSGYEHLSPAEAIAYQEELRQKIRICELTKPINTIAGADISFDSNSDILYAGIVVFKYPELTVLTTSTAISHTEFPYHPGLLAFREVPALFSAWNNLYTKPDLLVLDGQGIAHERRMGLATQFGLLTGVPTIGSAKNRLYGTCREPADETFAESPVYDADEIIGTALRSKRQSNPIYISPGHNISMQQSIDVIKTCIRGHRTPEPTRQAHFLVHRLRTENGEKEAGNTIYLIDLRIVTSMQRLTTLTLQYYKSLLFYNITFTFLCLFLTGFSMGTNAAGLILSKLTGFAGAVGLHYYSSAKTYFYYRNAGITVRRLIAGAWLADVCVLILSIIIFLLCRRLL